MKMIRLPLWKMLILRVDSETAIEMASVTEVMPNAAACRAPRPD